MFRGASTSKKKELSDIVNRRIGIMRHRFEALIAALVVLVLSAVFPVAVTAQAPTLAEQLAAQYKLVKMGADSSGAAVTEEGTLLEVKKGGILGSPYKNNTTRTATYQDGTIHSTDNAGKGLKVGNALCGLMHKCPTTPDAANQEATTKLFKIGDKVYASKIDVNNDKDTVTMGIIACDTCNKVDPPTYNKVNVVFQFAKGTLAKTSAGDVEDTIGQVFAISDTSQDQASDQGGQQQGGQQQGGQQQGGGQQQQQQTQTVQMGMTPDQVIAALGNPDQQFNVGPKQIFVYKTASVKVVFLGGKVVDVQ
jgi:hypothetical protein